jgi:broad specificity phosphatase PhoE
MGLDFIRMPTLYVIRHAEPELTGVLAGRSDPGLSAKGRRDASHIKIPECDVYSSPLRRARETAAILKTFPIIVDDLSEISYGEWDGLSWAEIERQWPADALAKLSNWQLIPPPGGEPWNAFATRVEAALTGILFQAKPAAIVAHEAVNAIIDRYFCNSNVINYRQSYCEVKQYHF